MATFSCGLVGDQHRTNPQRFAVGVRSRKLIDSDSKAWNGRDSRIVNEICCRSEGFA